MSQIVMLTIGAALYSTTVMIPQFLQEVMGYTATNAGLVLISGRRGPDRAVADCWLYRTKD